MKSLGGPVGGNEKGVKGRWVTTLMYLEDDEMEKALSKETQSIDQEKD